MEGWQPLFDRLGEFSDDFATSRDQPDRAAVRARRSPLTPIPIGTEVDCEAELQEIERRWDAEPGTPESDTFDMLVTQVEAYEKEGHDLPAPNPAAALEYFLKSRGLMRT